MMPKKPGSSGIVRWLCLSVIIISGIAVMAGIYGCDDSDNNGNDTQEPAVPELRAISAEQAVELAAYLRRVRVQGGTDEMPSRQLVEADAEDETGGETPIAWAMINASCEERALVLEYAAASSSFPLPEEPFVMREQDITAESVQALADNPGIDTATINIAGPLIMEAAFRTPDGWVLNGDPAIFYWAYHKGVVVNVEGTLKVIDLSTGDEPLDIDQWAHCLVDESVVCHHMDEDEFITMKGYWNSMMGAAYLPQDPPERICGYTITPMFTFRWDQTPMDLVEQLQWTPDSMITQTGGFQSLLSMDYGVTVSDEDAPWYTCGYTPHDTDWLCEYRDPPYCGQ
jgi:hypothetical protein